MTERVISVEGVSKLYRLGVISSGTLVQDVQRWWARVKGAPDPGQKVGETNDRTRASASGYVWALRDISFDVHRGDVLGVIGANGAGKSTLLKILSRVTAPTEGIVRIRGRIASLLEVGTGFHPELTGRENIFLNGAILGMTKREIRAKMDEITEFSGCQRYIDTPVKRYSSGMHVRLAFAVAAHLEPDILIVDEVLAVGDLEFQEKCMGKMRDVAGLGRTVIFVSHNMAAVTQLTARCLVLDSGRIDFCGPTEEAVERYAGRRAAGPVTGRRPIEQIACRQRYQPDPSVTLTEVGLQEAEIDVGGELRLDIGFRTSRAFPALRFGYTVLDEMGAPVLSGWSPGFDVGIGLHVRTLAVSDLHLAPGTYSLSLAPMTGGLEESKYPYDMLLGFGCFVVRPFTADRRPLGPWQRGWGHIVHRSSSVEPCGGDGA
jgi:lipopolysaccharide transport system ATP-binding protein